MIKVAVLDDYQNVFQQIVDVENYKDKYYGFYRVARKKIIPFCYQRI